LGTAHEQIGNFSEELEITQRIARIMPDSAIVHGNLSRSFSQLERYEEALNSARKSSSLDSKYPDAYLAAGRALQGLRDHAGALEEYQRVLDLKPESVEVLATTLINMGDAYLELRRDQEALVPLQKAVQLKPEWPEGHDLLGIVYFRQGDREAALQEHRSVQKINSSFDSELGKLLHSQRLHE
jgi:tetratricopeptide (TPR) repeat protein